MLQIYRPAAPILWSCVQMTGPDAADFLHRLTTVNVKILRPGQGAPGFFLTAQGKMKVYFQLWRVEPDSFLFELDAGQSGRWKQELLTTIDQYHFGEKFTLIEPQWSSVWVFGDVNVPESLRAFDHGARDFGQRWFSVWGASADVQNWASSLGAEELVTDQVQKMRIAATRPWIDSELSENTIPLEVGLKDAISENKGCYPGQEVIERIISLGSPARRLAKIEGTGPAPKPGDPIRSEDGAQEVGRITSVSATEGGFEALALVKKVHAKEGTEVQVSTSSATRARLVVIAPYA